MYNPDQNIRAKLKNLVEMEYYTEHKALHFINCPHYHMNRRLVTFIHKSIQYQIFSKTLVKS